MSEVNELIAEARRWPQSLGASPAAPMRDLIARLAAALEAASAPVEGDEREALIEAVVDALRSTTTVPFNEHSIAVVAVVRAVEDLGFRRPSTPTEEDVERAAAAYAEHVTGFLARYRGRTYTCRCGWSETGPDAQAAALRHRIRAALSAVHPEVTQ